MKNIFFKSLFIQICIFTFTFIFKSFSQPKQIMQFKHITPDEGLSSSSITCILQDQKGFIWVGTYDGLNRYDGYDFIIYKNQSNDSTSLSHNIIWTLYEDKQNNLLIGNADGLSMYNWGKDSFINYMSDRSSPLNGLHCTLRSIAEDTFGNLWLATDIGLIYFDRKNNQAIQYTHDPAVTGSLSDNNVEYVYIDHKQNLWINTRKGLNLFNRVTKTFKHNIYDNKGNDLSKTFFLDIVEDNKGNLWFGSYEGLYVLDSKKIDDLIMHNYHNDPRDPLSLSNDRILCLYVDKQDRLWIGTENGGLNLFNKKNETFYHYKSDIFNPNSLNNESIHAIYQDNSGNLWIGTFAGGLNVSKKNSDAILYYNNIPGVAKSLSHNSVTSFLEDHQSRIWIGTDGGGLNLFNVGSEKFIHYNSKNTNLNSDAVLSILEDSFNQIWLGTWAGGLNRYNENTKSFQSYTTKNSNIQDNNIFSVIEDNKGNLWLGSFQGGLIHYNRKSNTFINFTTENSTISSNMVEDVKEYTDGFLLLGTPNGLNIFNIDKKHFTVYLHSPDNRNSISNNSVHDILVANDTTIWLATQNGLNRFNPKTEIFTHYYAKDSLPDNVIKALVKDNTYKLWITTNRGVSRFDLKNNKYKNFTKEDGLQSNEFNIKSALKIKNGTILLGGTKGFNIIYPERITENINVPAVLLTEFRIFNKPVVIGSDDSPLKRHISDTEELTLSYKQSVLTFNFIAIDFTMPEKNQFAYMMKGFEQDWNYVKNQRIATYTNLDPGEYTFRVKASNNDGIWNKKGTSIRIIITPPFWQTLWFRILVILFLITMIYTVYKIRLRSIQANKQKLEINVEERTRELIRANKEIGKKAKALEIAKKETDNILHNVEEGFFILNSKNNIGSSYSAALEVIFEEKKLANKNLIQYLKGKIPDEELENLKEYLGLMFENTVDEIYLMKLNPLDQIKITLHHAESNEPLEKYLNILFKRITSNGNFMNHLFVTVRDITKRIQMEVQLDKLEQEKEKMLQLVTSLLENDPDMIKDFFQTTEQEISQLHDLLKQPEDKDNFKPDINEIFRLVNLVRMNSEALNLTSLSNKAQLFENIVVRIMKKNLKFKDELLTLIKNNQSLEEEFKYLYYLLKLIYDSMLEFHTNIKID